MKPGLYGLASLDGSPLRPEDADALGLLEGADRRQAPGVMVRAFDSGTALPSLHFHATPESLVAFAGYLDEPEELAGWLGVSATRSPAELAAMALERFGAEAAQRMVGEWSLLRWSVEARELTLLTSENIRDSLYWATNGRHVAVAAEPLRLGRLSWNALALNVEGFALSVGRAATRQLMGDGTPWKGIFRVQSASAEIFAEEGRKTILPAPERAVEPWRGDFEEAIEALNTLGRRIVGQSLRRYHRSGFLLSGGLDSTLLTALGSQERAEAAGGVFCLTSVAPEGSGLEDESAFSKAVAEQLGLPVRKVWPSQDADAYRPTPESFAYRADPVAGLRHYLYDALWSAARAEGADAVFDGVLGEMSLTEKRPAGSDADWLRRKVYAVRAWRLERVRLRSWPEQGFHARLAPQVLHALPTEWKGTWRAGAPERPKLRPSDLRGFHPGLEKNSGVESSATHGVRRIMPYRDRRLARFAAGLPYGFGAKDGQSRAMARAMLRGRVPENVRLRPRGLPFSPTYVGLIREQAGAAKRRVDVFYDAGVDRWLDLEWLKGALDRLGAGASPYASEQAQAQTTAVTAEFLVWARTMGVKL